MEPILAALQEAQIIGLVGILILLFLWESVHPFFAHFTGSFKSRGKHALRNLTIGALTLISHQEIWLWARRPGNGARNRTEVRLTSHFRDNTAHGKISQRKQTVI
jgi:hypothetical protein